MYLTLFLFLVVTVAAVYDLKLHKIPNLLTYPAVIVALVYHGAAHGLHGLGFSIEGLALGILMFVLPYLLGGMGAGDAKLMGAVGAVVGPRGVVNAFVCTGLAGGIYAVGLMGIHFRWTGTAIARRFPLFAAGYLGMDARAASQAVEKPRLYYGVAIAVGTLVSESWRLWKHGFLI